MEGNELYNRQQERAQKLAYLARRRILQEEGEAIARRAAEAEEMPRETVGESSAAAADTAPEPAGSSASFGEPEPTPRVAPPEPATPKQMPADAKATVKEQDEAKG